MKKKIVAMCATVAIAAVAVGGTLAYFTDTDAAKNVMTTGNVAIEQYEKDKAGNDFVQEQKLYPRVDTIAIDRNNIVAEDGFYNPAIKNVIDKVVTVENTGSEEAYVRTVFAFETQRHYTPGSSTEFTCLHDTYFGVLANNLVYTDQYFTMDGVEYVVAVCTYADPVASGATTDPSLKQFFLAPTANNEVATLFGETYDILVLSQAVQAEGFGDATIALDAAFGEVTAANAKAWFEAATF